MLVKHPHLVLEHVSQFTEQLRALRYREDVPVTLAVHSPRQKISQAAAAKARYKPVREGTVFGPLWSQHWFQVTGKVPARWAGSEVVLIFENEGEALVWQNGVPIQSIINSHWPTPQYVGPIRPHCRLLKRAKGGETVSCLVEMACSGFWGYLVEPFRNSQERREFTLQRVRLVRLDPLAWALWVRLDALIRTARCLPHSEPRRAEALTAAYDMTRLCVLDDRSTWEAACAAGDQFFDRKQKGQSIEISAVGEAHIDTGWLWPVEETKRKCAGAFGAVLRLMDDYPELKYSCSQALQLKWMKELYPSIWKEIQKRFKEGRFMPVGGAWVEPDCNVPSGESLVRQFLFGQRFFRQEFGLTCREFWQPDVFGYAAALPQIMKLAGMKHFFTGKLWGNQFNKPLHTTFLWEGIDGTQVLTHLPGVGGSAIEPDAIINTVNLYREQDRGHEILLPFGVGDAGGAPTDVMVERYRLLKDTAGFPRLRMRTVPEFFARCEKDIRDPAVWVGELYYEDHRGTYTTQAAVKRDNRRSEELLHELEFLGAVAHALKLAPYPREELHALWEIVLVNQFHDILPGSSIPEVYVETRKDYSAVARRGQALKAKLLTVLGREPVKAVAADVSEARPFGVPVPPALSRSKPNLLVVNPVGFARSEVVATTTGPVLVDVPAYGCAVVEPRREAADRAQARAVRGGWVLENALVRARLNRSGRLVSLLDKRTGRESIADGQPANQFVLFEDRPTSYDAWNIEAYHLEKRQDVGTIRSLKIGEKGGLAASLELEYRLTAQSTLTQTIRLTAGSPRLDFECTADWHETDRMLKVEFPLTLHSDHATYEIQFGHLRRPTHFNTSWDMAKFEVAAQRWADLSESNFGVALLNDSKYGYACHGHVMRLTLLRAPTWPDPEADRGIHTFKYALLPHAGSPQAGGVVQAAMAFNQPLTVLPTADAPLSVSFFAVDNPAIILDTVKKAEDSDDLIVRLYEAGGSQQTGRLTASLPIRAATRVNLLEDDLVRERWADGLTLTLRPFEIVSYRLKVR